MNPEKFLTTTTFGVILFIEDTMHREMPNVSGSNSYKKYLICFVYYAYLSKRLSYLHLFWILKVSMLDEFSTKDKLEIKNSTVKSVRLLNIL